MPRASKAATSPACPRYAKSPPARWAWKCSKRFPVEILSAGKVPPKAAPPQRRWPRPRDRRSPPPPPHPKPERRSPPPPPTPTPPPPPGAPHPGRTPPPAQAGAPPAAVAAANAAAASFTALTSRLDYLDAASIEQVRQAYRFADEAHLGQLRDSGEPYITHPIAVAAQCTAWKLDAQ